MKAASYVRGRGAGGGGRATALKAFVLVAVLSLLLAATAARAVVDGFEVGLEDGWVWQVAVLPPDEGWDSEQGRSAIAAIRLAEWEVMDSADGIRGRDIRFLQEPPLDGESAASRVADWRKNGVSAVLSMSGGDDIPILRPLLAGKGPVLLSAYGEHEKILDADGAPDRMVFALDLYSDFRVQAFADYASVVLSAGSVVALMADRLDPALECRSRNLGEMLSEKGFDSEYFWIPGGAMDSFRLMESEMLSSGAKVLITWAGSMVVRDVWRATRLKTGGFEIWYGGAPQPLLLSFDGVVAADQDYPVRTDASLAPLLREIRRRLNLIVKDAAVAGRAYVACKWLFDAFERSGSPAPSDLAAFMPLAQGLPFGSQTLSVNPVTHRPVERRVSFMKVAEKSFHQVDTLTVRGPENLR